MNKPDEVETNQKLERQIRSVFPVEEPDPIFINRLQKQLAERFKDAGKLSKGERRSPLLGRDKLLFSSLAWGAIGLFFILALIWTIKTLIPGFEPVRGVKPRPSPTEEATRVPTQSGSTGVIDLPALVGTPVPWPQEAINATNASQVSLLAHWGRGMITDVLWSDGKTMAVASFTGIFLYDTNSFEELGKLGNGSVSGSPVYSANGRVVAGVQGDTIILWDAASGKELHSLPEQPNSIASLAFSPNGALLATGYDYSIIKLWDVASGNELATLNGSNENELIDQLVFSHDGSLLISLATPSITIASKGNRGTIRIWDVASREELRTLPDCKGYLMALSPKSQSVAITQDGGIAICDLDSGAVLKNLQLEAYPIAFSPDGSKFVGGVDGSIKVWDASTFEEMLTFGENLNINWMAFSPDGSRLATATASSVKIWDLNKGEELNTLTASTTSQNGEAPSQLGRYGYGIADLALSPDGKLLASVPDVGPLQLYDTATGVLLAELPTQLGHNFRVRFSPDGKLIAVGGWKMGSMESYVGVVQIWDVATRETIKILDGFSQYVFGVAFSPDGLTLATGEGNGYGIPGAAKLWNIATGELLQEFGQKVDVAPPDYFTVYDVAFSPDGSTLATANGDGSIVLWDIANQRQEAILTNTANIPIRISFSPDGRYLAAAGSAEVDYQKTDLRVLDVSTGATLFINEVQNTRNIVFSPDGQVLASSSYYGNATLWDVASGNVLATLTGVGSPALVFSPDGTMLITGSDDGTIGLWGVSPLSTIQQTPVSILTGVTTSTP